MSVTTVKFQGKARNEATHHATHEILHTDAGKASGGLGEYGTPVSLLATSLAACAMTTMEIAAEKAGIDFTGCRAEVGEYELDMENLRVKRLQIEFHLKAEFDEKFRKKLEHFAHKGCIVGNTLDTEKDFTFIYE
ncbi:MAG: OsmC family protein [Hoylesella marshii]|uniref:OsmC-like protein n=1 Tax=Hoylesella marshii DSM 16973 = JCM 13450 TaxID=862515 RepID=E0NUA7_9BACT|nr:OsmC family protein [Hoylesella marshii]EFM01198.1 OsmC-like protein [Hoylesella marshii DSM 16973 = JCM 13450]